MVKQETTDLIGKWCQNKHDRSSTPTQGFLINLDAFSVEIWRNGDRHFQHTKIMLLLNAEV